jgi:hypothetical protein
MARDLDWLRFASGEIVHTDYLGLMNAYLKSHERSGGTAAKVMQIGSDGEPVELEP